MTRDELIKRYPLSSESFIRANLPADCARATAKLESNSGNAPLDKKEVQRQAGTRFFVRVTSVRKRLLDESNLCYKYHEDLCRYAGVLPSDAPDKCHSEVNQRKTVRGEAEHTVIEIYQLL